MKSPTNAERYLAFIAAVLAGDLPTMRTMINADMFHVIMPRRGRMTFEEYASFMAELRKSAPDFGDHTVIHGTIEQDTSLSMRYFTRFTVVGATPGPVEYTGVDWIVFDADGKIMAIFIYFDLGDNQLQAYGREVDV
jgi:hypothetical protein